MATSRRNSEDRGKGSAAYEAEVAVARRAIDALTAGARAGRSRLPTPGAAAKRMRGVAGTSYWATQDAFDDAMVAATDASLTDWLEKVSDKLYEAGSVRDKWGAHPSTPRARSNSPRLPTPSLTRALAAQLRNLPSRAELTLDFGDGSQEDVLLLKGAYSWALRSLTPDNAGDYDIHFHALGEDAADHLARRVVQWAARHRGGIVLEAARSNPARKGKRPKKVRPKVPKRLRSVREATDEDLRSLRRGFRERDVDEGTLSQPTLFTPLELRQWHQASSELRQRERDPAWAESARARHSVARVRTGVSSSAGPEDFIVADRYRVLILAPSPALKQAARLHGLSKPGWAIKVEDLETGAFPLDTDWVLPDRNTAYRRLAALLRRLGVTERVPRRALPNASADRKAWRAEMREKHGPDWWKDKTLGRPGRTTRTPRQAAAAKRGSTKTPGAGLEAYTRRLATAIASEFSGMGEEEGYSGEKPTVQGTTIKVPGYEWSTIIVEVEPGERGPQLRVRQRGREYVLSQKTAEKPRVQHLASLLSYFDSPGGSDPEDGLPFDDDAAVLDMYVIGRPGMKKGKR